MIAELPKEIDEKFEKCKPYFKELHKEEFQNVPDEVKQAYEELKAWAWEQGQ